MTKRNITINIALFIALLFHFCGAVGMIATGYRQWFINNTPLTLLLMCALLVITQSGKNARYWIFFALCFFAGFLAEVAGVNTGLLFGDYEYGNVLGYKLWNVPLLIGVNWFVIIFCAGSITQQLNEWILKKMGNDEKPARIIQQFSFIADAAFLAVFFDWVMEPAAIKLQFWKWLPDGKIPFYNYVCWFVISAMLLFIFNRFNFNKHNQFAVHLFIMQVLFFTALRLYL